MDYTEYQIKWKQTDIPPEVVLALISDLPFDSFEEGEQQLLAYVPVSADSPGLADQVQGALAGLSEVVVQRREIRHRNWNAVWESNFDPVMVEDRLYIRAPFHPEEPAVPMEIVMVPKMAFGTGHHATTYLMAKHMLRAKWQGKKVLDAGCGTAVLAILANKLGSEEVWGYDIDPHAVENAGEHVALNHANVRLSTGTIADIDEFNFDVILANINRNILLGEMKEYARRLQIGGQLYLSGFYREDVEILARETKKHHLQATTLDERDAWCIWILTKTE